MHPVLWAAICAACFSYASVSAVLTAIEGSLGWTLFYALGAAWSAFEGIEYLLSWDEVE